MSTDGHTGLVDFDRLRACLATLSAEYPDFLRRAVLIGGGACWFYRAMLERGTDPDFKVPSFTTEEESRWLSKDMDFTGLMAHEAGDLMPDRWVPDETGRRHLSINGVRLGFAQMGFWLDAETARQTCRRGRVLGPNGTPVDFLVVDPIALYREKQYAAERRNAPGDRPHLALLREFLRREAVRQVDELLRDPSLDRERECVDFLRRLRDTDAEILRDGRVRRRMTAARETTPGSLAIRQAAAAVAPFCDDDSDASRG